MIISGSCSCLNFVGISTVMYQDMMMLNEACHFLIFVKLTCKGISNHFMIIPNLDIGTCRLCHVLVWLCPYL